ncbi:FliM/FliN family flagellar motor switch protein [Sulfitobacter sp. 20_GPM-1509m]|uniref:FliM/FliN family flagellar motor switch protein n=1 Tax=Sulfitobacter sp. 20_GPM-1509m TaxID=1380367 RepID=UPI00068915C1|nr:FliM/FliN family flagellar motor switch protein [Sulfitobacter sp. 20_GPM-1509m]
MPFFNASEKAARRVTPIAWPARRISAAGAELSSRLASLLPDLKLELPSLGPLTLSLYHGDAPLYPAETLHLQCGDMRFTLAFARPLLEPLLAQHSLESELGALLADPGLAALVIEHLLTPLLERFEAASGHRIALTKLTPWKEGTSVDPSKAVVALRLDGPLWDGDTNCLLFSDDTNAPITLQNLIHAAPAGTSNPRARAAALNLSVRVSLQGPDLTMTQREAAKFQVGDGIFLPTGASLTDEMRLVFANRLAAPCETAPSEGGVRLIAPLFPLQKTRHEEPQMRGTDTEHDTDTDADTVPISELPVTLSVELDRCETTFHELEKMREGSIVPFNGDGDQTLRLLANGRAFAVGEMVAIEDEYGTIQHGIRILRFAAHPRETAPHRETDAS